MGNCCKVQNFLDLMIKASNRNDKKHKLKTVIAVIVIFLFFIILYLFFRKFIELNITDSCKRTFLHTYMLILMIFGAITLVVMFIFSFNKLCEETIKILSDIFIFSLTIVWVCIFPFVIIDIVVRKVFGENNDFIFFVMYVVPGISFLLCLLAIILIIIKAVGINISFEQLILFSTFLSYVFSLLWCKIYEKYLNFDKKNIRDIRKFHNVFLYVFILFVFIVNNYVLAKCDAINNAITSFTLLVLILEERGKSE